MCEVSFSNEKHRWQTNEDEDKKNTEISSIDIAAVAAAAAAARI